MLNEEKKENFLPTENIMREKVAASAKTKHCGVRGRCGLYK